MAQSSPQQTTSADAKHYLELLTWLFKRQRFGLKPGLETIRGLLKTLDHPEDNFETILVAGTNGKGSTSSTLASILSQTTRTALFTSPHLTHFAERFVVNGQPLPEASIYPALAHIQPLADELGATFFEITTALACQLFAEADVNKAVFEVGMGGRFDATNALTPIRSLITNVSLDHTEYLGETEAAIAGEKAGILRAYTLALSAAQGDALEVIQQRARDLKTPLWSRYTHDVETSDEVQNIHLEARLQGWQGAHISIHDPKGTTDVQSPLLGAHQLDNVSLAVAAAHSLDVSDDAIQAGVSQTTWAGRLEPITAHERTFLLDGAHNPTSAGALANALAELTDEPVLLVFGVAAGKDLAGIVDALSPQVRAVITTQAALSPRAIHPQQVADAWNKPITLSQTPDEAIRLAVQQSQSGEVIVVAGSLYLIGEVRPKLLGEPLEHWERWQ